MSDLNIKEIRHKNARKLLDEVCRGSLSEFARVISRSPAQVGSFLRANPEKGIGVRTARLIEESFGKPNGWLDSVDIDGSKPLSVGKAGKGKSNSEINRITHDKQAGSLSMDRADLLLIRELERELLKGTDYMREVINHDHANSIYVMLEKKIIIQKILKSTERAIGGLGEAMKKFAIDKYRDLLDTQLPATSALMSAHDYIEDNGSKPENILNPGALFSTIINSFNAIFHTIAKDALTQESSLIVLVAYDGDATRQAELMTRHLSTIKKEFNINKIIISAITHIEGASEFVSFEFNGGEDADLIGSLLDAKTEIEIDGDDRRLICAGRDITKNMGRSGLVL